MAGLRFGKITPNFADPVFIQSDGFGAFPPGYFAVLEYTAAIKAPCATALFLHWARLKFGAVLRGNPLAL